MIPGPRTPALAATLIVLAALAAYANTFRVPFLFDDVASIVDNPTIRRLWPPGDALSPPTDFGFTVSGRPLLNLSFALNYAISGLNVWSYHALNLVIHTLAGLTLFGLIRRTLALRCRAGSPNPAVRGAHATPLAFAIALLWTLHPLQTESVTYIVQRAESLMGLFFLATLYGFARSLDSPHPHRWQIFSVAACLLCVGTKEIAVLAPVLVFLYDRTFASGTIRAAWQRHRWRHLALFATWIPLALLLASTGGNRGGTSGFNVGISWSGYWLTQFEAVIRYLQLALWPHPLVFDYGKISTTALAALPFAIPVVVLVALTLVALWRWPVAGFLGSWFFALLAPTSVMPGTLQMIVEHRMYLPLAAVIAAAFALAAKYLSPRAILGLGAALALAAGLATAQRNALYHDEKSLWQQTLAHRPANARAHNNLGLLLYREDRLDAALAHFRDSLRLDPTVAQTHFNLGLALMKSGRVADAVAPLQEATRILPYFFNAHLNLGLVLVKLGRAPEALDHFTTAVRYDPAPAEAHFQFGVALASLGRWPEAAAHYAQASQLRPDHAETHSNWAVALVRTDNPTAAIEHFLTALRLQPDLPEVHFNFALLLLAQRRLPEAIDRFQTALRLRPDDAQIHFNLAYALVEAGRLSEARSYLETALRLQPDHPAARDLLRRLTSPALGSP